MDCSVSCTACGPRDACAAARSVSAPSGVLTTGGTPRVCLSSACTRYGSAIAATSSSRRGATPSQAAASIMRKVPRASPTSGMTFGTAPECTEPQTRAATLRGSSRRVKAAGRSVMTFARA